MLLAPAEPAPPVCEPPADLPELLHPTAAAAAAALCLAEQPANHTLVWCPCECAEVPAAYEPGLASAASTEPQQPVLRQHDLKHLLPRGDQSIVSQQCICLVQPACCYALLRNAKPKHGFVEDCLMFLPRYRAHSDWELSTVCYTWGADCRAEM